MDERLDHELLILVASNVWYRIPELRPRPDDGRGQVSGHAGADQRENETILIPTPPAA